jgi:hypothetical protein
MPTDHGYMNRQKVAGNALLCILAIAFLLPISCKSKQSALPQDTGIQPARSDAKTAEGQVSGPTPPVEVTDTAGKEENRPFMQIRAGIKLENIAGKDVIKVIAAGIGKDSDKLTFQYEWTKNNEPAGNGDSISGFKRGDKITVKVTPFEGKEPGQSRILSTEIRNSTPQVTEGKMISFDGKTLTYQVAATDPDGYELTYMLEDAPPGMVIDKSSGIIKWEIQKEDTGKRSVRVKISDGHGGEVIYGLNIDIDLLREGK